MLENGRYLVLLDINFKPMISTFLFLVLPIVGLFFFALFCNWIEKQINKIENHKNQFKL